MSAVPEAAAMTISAVGGSGPAQPATSRRDADGVVEEVGTLPGAEVCAFVHRPAAPRDSAVVVCSPTHAEHLRNYRREVLLARHLAARGHVVARFHYRGTGLSRGADGLETLGTMIEDATCTARALVDAHGCTSLAFVGTRLGALVASRAADSAPGSPLVLCEPVGEGRDFLRDLYRAGAMVGDGERGFDDREHLLAALRADGMVEVAGIDVHAPLVDSVLEESLTTSGRRRVLLMVANRTGTVRRSQRDLRSRLESAGATVDTVVVADDEAWWYERGGDRLLPEAERPLTRALVDDASTWIERSLRADP